MEQRTAESNSFGIFIVKYEGDLLFFGAKDVSISLGQADEDDDDDDDKIEYNVPIQALDQLTPQQQKVALLKLEHFAYQKEHDPLHSESVRVARRIIAKLSNFKSKN